MMYKSQFQKIDPYDWFCSPVSQIDLNRLLVDLFCSMIDSMQNLLVWVLL